MKKVVYFDVFRYGPRDITLVCTEIQKKIICAIYFEWNILFHTVDCMDVICMVEEKILWSKLVHIKYFLYSLTQVKKSCDLVFAKRKKYMHFELVALNI